MNIFKLFLLIFLTSNLLASIDLSQEEKNWIKQNPVIKVGVDANWPPFDYIDKEGIHQGISSEYLNLISQKTGLNFDIYADKWSSVLGAIKNKQMDILACASITPERLAYLNFTDSYVDVDIAVALRKDFKLDNFDDIKNFKIALPKGNFVHERLKEKFPNAQFVFVKSNEEALEYVSYNKADIYVGNMPVISHFIEKNFLTNLTIAFKAPFEKAKLAIAVAKHNEILHSILNKAILSIPSEQRKTFQSRWINQNIISDEKKLQLDLSYEEKKWLNENEVIKVAGNPFWPPYSFYNDKGEYVGLVPDLVKEVFKNTNTKVEYIKTSSWSESIELMKNKEIALIDSIAYSNEKASFLNFSSKYVSSEIVIIANKTQDKYVNSLNNIKNKNIGMVKGYSVVETINHEYPAIKNITLYDNSLEGLKELSNSQIDYFILDIPSFEYYSKTEGLSNLKIVGPTGYNFKYGFGVSKDEELLLSIVNKLLDNVDFETKEEIYRKWIKIDYTKQIDYDLIWKILIIAFFVLAGTVYWNRKLQIEIKERQKVQEKLKESHDFTHAIMNSQVDIVITTTGEDIKQANKAFFDFFEYENLEEFKKEHSCICDLFDESNAAKYITFKTNNILWIDEVLNNPNTIYKALIYKNNEAHVFKISASYISQNSELKTAVFTDITKLENLNEVLLKAKNEALNVAKQKSEFLANMSHEIRTPMNSVIGFTELLDKEITNPVQKDYLNSIKKGGHSLLRIINDILDLSKIEAGKLEIKKESVNPSNLFLEIESIFHSKIISKNISFIVDIDSSIPKNIIIDSVRVRQILFNLIGNAIKFTEKGHIKLKVENVYKDNIKSKIDLIFSVEDTGIGIDEQSVNNIFNAFEQQKNQDDAKYGGTGLGLAICTKLIKMMNGEIKVKSQKTKGTTFTVYLHDVAVSSVEENIECNKLDVSNIAFDEATILVVDDIEENRKLVNAALKDYGFKLIMACDGQDAIDKLKNVKVDLILMDLRMPVMNGYEAAVYIKNDENLKTIPLIALTASVMGKDLEKVSEYGFDGYLRKPVIIDDLIEELSKYISYTFIDKAQNDLVEDFNNISYETLDKVLVLLQNEFKVEWENIKDKGDFTLIEEFANKLKNLALDNSLELLNSYANELLTHIESFDIEKVDYLMGTYLDLSSRLEVLKEKVERK